MISYVWTVWGVLVRIVVSDAHVWAAGQVLSRRGISDSAQKQPYR